MTNLPLASDAPSIGLIGLGKLGTDAAIQTLAMYQTNHSENDSEPKPFSDAFCTVCLVSDSANASMQIPQLDIQYMDLHAVYTKTVTEHPPLRKIISRSALLLLALDINDEQAVAVCKMVTNAAKKIGSFSVVMLTMPATIEDMLVKTHNGYVIGTLQKHCDTLFCLPCENHAQKLCEVMYNKTAVQYANVLIFRLVDQLYTAVTCEGLIYEDIKMVLKANNGIGLFNYANYKLSKHCVTSAKKVWRQMKLYSQNQGAMISIKHQLYDLTIEDYHAISKIFMNTSNRSLIHVSLPFEKRTYSSEYNLILALCTGIPLELFLDSFYGH